MIPAQMILEVIDRHPKGMTTQQCGEALGVGADKVIGRLSKLHAYGQIRKVKIPGKYHHGVAVWMPKVSA